MARLLLDRASSAGQPLQVRRAEVADLLSVTAVSVARLLADLRREDLFEEQRRHIVLLDRDRLRHIAQSCSGRAGKRAGRGGSDPPTSLLVGESRVQSRHA